MLVLAIASIAPALGDTWVDSFDAPEPCWRLQPGQSRATLRTTERLRLPSADGGDPVGAERLRYVCQPAYAAWFWRETPAAAVIDELVVEADVRADVPGVVLAVEITLPRTIDASTGKPRRVVVRQRPTRPTAAGDVRLVLDELPRRLRDQTRVLRAKQALAAEGPSPIDDRGAFVTRVGLAAPGDGRPRDLFTKEVRISPLVRPPRLRDVADSEAAEGGPALAAPALEPGPSPGGRVVPTRVTLNSEGFRVDDKPFFPRVWRWRGESLESLAARGFNTVWIDRPPTSTVLEEASRQRLRVIAAPPTDAADLPDARASPLLAWALPAEVSADDVDTRLVVVEACRALPVDWRRPLLVVTDAAEVWSRIADGLLVSTSGSRVSGVSQPSSALHAIAQAVRPGTPLLGVVRADVEPATLGQIDALLDGAVVAGWLPPSVVADSVHETIAAGCCGVAFSSTERLDGPDDPTEAAATWLELRNARLRLLEPWLVGPRGRRVATASDTLLLDRHHVRIALPRPFANARRVTLSGIGEGASLQRISLAGVRSVSANRVAGGVAIERNEARLPGLLLLSEDPRVRHSLRRYTRTNAATASAKLLRYATAALRDADAIEPAVAASAKRQINDANLAVARGAHARAYDRAWAALVDIESSSRQRRSIATDTSGGLQSSPLAVLPATLTDHFKLMQFVHAARRGVNRLAGGSFEDIDTVRRHGWRHEGGGEDRSSQAVRLVEPSTIHGTRRLRMSADAGGAAVRIASPEVEVTERELFEITGWARVDAPADGTLTVVDSLGGRELGIVLGETPEWTPFRLLRRAPNATSVRVDFVLRGEAVADIDGVMLRSIEPATRSAAAPRRTDDGAVGYSK